ncbi:MAG: tRNA (adenosine(37)-N6)-dimethylallyltransferase MiaA [Candidatus Berkelbacteria bacterium]
MKTRRRIIAIVGPTASGKTSWGVPIAKKFNGEIISADSRQVYKGLDIGTSKDAKDYGEIPYHLIDICDAGEQFSMFDWLDRARTTIEEIFSRGKTPIVVGGTGLYIQALVEGFALEVASHKSQVTKYSRGELESKTLKQLQKIFLKLDTCNLQLDTSNPYRLIRAIERAQSGEAITKKKPDFEVLQIAIDRLREELYQRIDDGVEEWFEEGFIEEIKVLLDAGVDPKWLEKIGLEYRILTDFLICHPEFISGSNKNEIPKQVRNDKGEIVEDKEFLDMKQKMKFAIHAYARRQLTWFRRFSEIVWCKDIKSAEKEIKKFLK